VPQERFGGLTYQQYLNSLSKEEGLLVEMKRASQSDIHSIVEWDYSNPNVFEIKYEELRKDEEGIFRKLFHHYGLRPPIVEAVIKAARRFNLERMRKLNRVGAGQHIRSGSSGQWKSEFSKQHKEWFKLHHGPDLIKLGYEKNLDW
jgi:hypothetical protein